jgi:hypothetical protein
MRNPSCLISCTHSAPRGRAPRPDSRLAVANHAQVAHTMLYLAPQEDALNEALAAAEAAARSRVTNGVAMNTLELAHQLKTQTGLQTSAVAQLRQSLRGELVLSGDAGYEQARRVWNGMVDKRPIVIVYCAGPEDVVRLCTLLVHRAFQSPCGRSLAAGPGRG